MKNKRKNKKVEKKNFEKKNEKKKEKKGKAKKKITVDYCCHPQCFVCGGTKINKYNFEK
jgi:hypothetical protein